MQQLILKYKLYYLPFILLFAELLRISIHYIFSYSLDVIGLEYYFVHIGQQILQHRNIYPDPESLPFDNCLYTPIYFYIYSAAIFISSYNITEEIHQLFVIGRMLSFCLIIAQLITIYKICRKITPSLLISCIVTVTYSLLITRHMNAIRPDALKVLFFLLFIYYIITYFFISKNNKNAFLLIITATLAVYTKQDIFILITLCFISAYYLTKDKFTFYTYSIFILCCLAGLIVCVSLFGKSFITNILFLNIQSVSHLFQSYNIIFIGLSLIRTAPFILLSFLAYQKLKNKKENIPLNKFILLNSLLFYPVAHLSMCRAGSNLNYTYELASFLSLSIAVYYEINVNKILQQKATYYTLAISILFLLFLFNCISGNYSYSAEKEKIYKTAYEENIKQRNKIKEITKEDYLFFPNTSYSVFYNNNHIILGHDMHLDRFIDLYTPLKSISGLVIQTHLPFINTQQYDDCFKNGTIRYIGIENQEKHIQHVAEYYPDYIPYKKIGNLLIYQYSKKAYEE